MHMSYQERALKWVKQKNKYNPKLLQVVSSENGRSVFLVAMSDKKRPIKLCRFTVLKRQNYLTGYRLDVEFAADGVEAIVDKDGKHLGYKFQRPYREVIDEQGLGIERALWVYMHRKEELLDFDFSFQVEPE